MQNRLNPVGFGLAILVCSNAFGYRLLLKSWTYYSSSNSGLINNEITCLTKDTKGNIWIGTKFGVAHYDGSPVKNLHYHQRLGS